MLALMLALAAASAPGAAPEGEPIVLDPIEVNPIPDPLDGLRNLRKSLPCVGCGDGIIKAKESLAERAMRYFILPVEPPEPTEFEKDRAREFCAHGDPGSENYCSP